MPASRIQEERDDRSDDEKFQHRQWLIQRIGWVALAMIVAAGLAGLLGHGPLSNAEVGSSALRLAYHRFERVDAATSIEMELMDSGSRRDLAVWLGREFLDAFEVTRIVPQSRADVVDPKGTTFLFSGGDTPGICRITFFVEPRKVGSVAGRVAAGGTAPLAFRQIVLP